MVNTDIKWRESFENFNFVLNDECTKGSSGAMMKILEAIQQCQVNKNEKILYIMATIRFHSCFI